MVCGTCAESQEKVGLDYEIMQKRIPYGGNCVGKIRMLNISMEKNKWFT